MVLWSGMLAVKARSGDSAEDFRKNQIQNMHFFTFCGFPSKSDHRIWIFSINRFQGVYIMKFENTFYGFLILLKHVLALCSKFSVMVLATHTLKSPTSLGKDRYDWPWLAHNDWTRTPALTKTYNDCIYCGYIQVYKHISLVIRTYNTSIIHITTCQRCVCVFVFHQMGHGTHIFSDVLSTCWKL